MHGSLSWPLTRAVRVHGDDPAVVDGERRVSYRELGDRVAALGGGLERLGVAPGAVVGMLGENSLEHLECWLGIPAHGRVLNDLNTRLSVRELAFMVEDCGTEVLAVDARFLDLGRELAQRCDCVRQLVFAGSGPAPEGCVGWDELVGGPAVGFPELDADELATISYTGGTTGRPKGVMLSHGNLLANAKHMAAAGTLTHADRYLHAAPMFHVADTSQTFALTWAGGCHVIAPRFDVAACAAAIEREQVSYLLLVPTMLGMLLDHLDGCEPPPDLGSLRLVMYAASPIAPSLQRRALASLPCDFTQMYGMTEAAPLVTQCSTEIHARAREGEEPYASLLASVGAPVPGVQAEVRGEQGEPLAPGEIGEVWVRGPNVMLGYFNRPEETAAALVDGGWYRSGDAGYLDAGDNLFIVDRVKDMIITGGENVYSTEVEAALLEHHAVRECAVFGIPDERWGEAVHAVVVCVEGSVAEEELRTHVHDLLAGYKVPRSVTLQTEPLPKSGAGKLLKHVLRAPFWAGAERQVN